MKNIKINDIPAFRRTLKNITNIPEMSLSPYILKSDMNLSEKEFTQKYYFSNQITSNDFKALIDFLNKQKEENVHEIQKAQNSEQIIFLIKQLIELTDFESIMDNNDKNTKTKEKLTQLNNIEQEQIINSNQNSKKITSRTRTDYIIYTKEKSESFNIIIKLLKVTPFNEIYGKLPISISNFYYLKAGNKNGEDFTVTSESINKISDYFVPIIKDRYSDLSDEEQENLKKNFENFSGRTFQALNNKSNKKQPVNNSNLSREKKSNVKPASKDIKSVSSTTTLLTIEMSNAIKNICSILNLKPSYKQKGGLPISEYSLHYWTKPIEKGVRTNKFLELKNYFQNIISNGKSYNLSDENWNIINQSWEILNSQLPDIKENKVKNHDSLNIQSQNVNVSYKELAKNKPKRLSENEDFVLNHLELIKRKKESDNKLELILLEIKQERYNRDRDVKIQDALKDIPIISTLAVSKEKQYLEKVYEIKDFTITDNESKNLSSNNIKEVNFISENSEVDSAKNKIYISQEDYEQYQLLKKEIQKEKFKVDTKFILDSTSKLALYMDYSY